MNNEQHCIKQNEKSFIQKDLSLTEQWKKGELPNGMYYIEFKDGDIVKDVYAFGSWGNINEHFLKQVLAPVPSYQEYLALQSDSLAKNEAVEINAELEAQNEQLKSEYEKECHRADELEDSYWKAEKDNQKLKELLESTLSWLSDCSKLRGGRYAQLQNLKRKINEVLK